jgi:ADP-heptose:LPS heptosyltransferase
LARTIAALDLVVTVDTMAAHLAGALGVRTWLLLHSDPDWRWMSDRSDSPWYPLTTIYRQTEARMWDPMLRRVRHDLEVLAASRTARE